MEFDWFDDREYEGELVESKPDGDGGGSDDSGGGDSLGEFDDAAPDAEGAPPPVMVKVRCGVLESFSMNLDGTGYPASAYVFEFDDYASFVRQAEQMPDTGLGELHSRSDTHHEPEWYGGCSFEEAVTLGRHGWKEGAQMVYAKLEVLHDRITTRRVRKEVGYDRQGPGVIDYQRLLQGHPMPWVTWQNTDVTENGGGQVVTVLFNGGVSGQVDTESIIRKGVLACALIDLLERSGRRCEVVVIDASQGSGLSIVIRTLLKKASEPLDIDRIAFALAHPAALRRLGFSVLEHVPDEYRQACRVIGDGSYGYPLTFTEPGAIIFDATAGESDDEQVTWLKQRLEEQGIMWEM